MRSLSRSSHCPPPFAFLFSSLLSLLPLVSSLRREWRDKSPPLSRLSNQQKLAALSLPQLLWPASSKQSTSAAGEESNNISGQQQLMREPAPTSYRRNSSAPATTTTTNQ
ncbi:hypothetical protein KY284_032455 [Solanum tuberosum]|nr:hypothetical protein KY284_032455 [Solanum tuberosum]